MDKKTTKMIIECSIVALTAFITWSAIAIYNIRTKSVNTDNLYAQYAVCYITDIDETVFIDATGNTWAIDATDEYIEGDMVELIMDNNGTDNTIEDDIIVNIVFQHHKNNWYYLIYNVVVMFYIIEIGILFFYGTGYFTSAIFLFIIITF